MKLYCNIQLPASKSESNRALMIAAYGGFAPDIQNLSDSKDTQILMDVLNGIYAREVDVKDCGTAARFLTTYLACHEGTWFLTGTDRMKQRPIKPLVDALMALGADIQYVEKQGSLPLQIYGKPIQGGKVTIDMTQSSQFASSLLLAAPMFPQGLELELHGELNSMPYLEMTLAMMRHFGADLERHDGMIIVKPKPYQPMSFKVSADWTAASYWYEMAALSDECEIRLRSLKVPEPAIPEAHRRVEGPMGCRNLQGDSIIAEWMRHLGVGTYIENDSIVLRKIPFEKRTLSFDFSHHPDLYPTMVATCAALQVEAEFLGLGNLGFKESDRVEAMRTELSKLGESPLHFSSHDDHRVVMALAPLTLRYGPVIFDHPEVVEKSYPNFWSDCSFLAFL